MSKNNRLSRFVIWICSKFNRNEVEFIVSELTSILSSRNSEVLPRDDTKEKQPNYRNYFVDPHPPLTEPVKKKK